MIYVVTAVHNRYSITKNFVMQLQNQSYKDIQLVLVDDGSTDGTAGMVKERMPNAVILQGNGDLWWGGALHMAYKWLKENGQPDAYVMYANDDTTFDDKYIEKGIELIRRYPHTLITGCGYSRNSGKLIDAAVEWNFKTGEMARKLIEDAVGNCASTRSLFMEFEALLKIGGFHPVLLPHYGSDYEWTIRGAKRGYPIRSFKELCYEFDEGTTGDNFIEKITIKKLLSKRSVLNPIYRISYLLLVTPIHLIPGNLVHQMKRYGAKIKYIKTNY